MRRRRFAGWLDYRSPLSREGWALSNPWVSSPANLVHKEFSVPSDTALRVSGKRSRSIATPSDAASVLYSQLSGTEPRVRCRERLSVTRTEVVYETLGTTIRAVMFSAAPVTAVELARCPSDADPRGKESEVAGSSTAAAEHN